MSVRTDKGNEKERACDKSTFFADKETTTNKSIALYDGQDKID